ncbi:hypothetical protein EK21DRAFT_109301 [Setomelanomma holmii]|uniref:ABM domain-containing protein n=1 Tax=Setomelanomma holmii TaxID=210430 RepID=A0A9P4LQW3_9PLEO|nr:hypothetical protein EK21DRAFT_109301 [Setomelanomma holmii]
MATDPTNPPHLSSFSAHVKITVAPASVPAFLEALKSAYDAVVAEPECASFQVLQHPQEPGVFKFIESWNMSVEEFMTVQVHKDYYKPYLAITEPMWIKPREIEIWERASGDGKEWVYFKPQA